MDSDPLPLGTQPEPDPDNAGVGSDMVILRTAALRFVLRFVFSKGETMKRTKTLALCRGGIAVALALALSYLKIPVGAGFGGSVDFVMLPLIVFAALEGTLWGVGAGFVFGVLKYFLGSGFGINWVSILLDYSIAYAAVGIAGLFGKRLSLGALCGCAARFAVHFISGITVYASYMPEEFLGLRMGSVWLYSLLYNGTYMLPNTVAAVIICVLLNKPVARWTERR